MKKTINILLIFLLTGAPSLLANSSSSMVCCHNTHTSKKMDSHSCCEIEKPEEQSSASCDIMEMNASSFDSCGCIHELANNVDDSILTSIKIDFSASLIIDNAVSDNSNDNVSFSKNFSSFRFNTHSIPIYISVSSYLI